MKDAGFPIVLIVLGLAWLLHTLDWLPDVRWAWVIGLAGTGIAILLIEGITKSSVVAGPLLMLAGGLSFLRQFYGLGWKYMIPVMLIATGLTMLIARAPSIPETSRLRRARDRDSSR